MCSRKIGFNLMLLAALFMVFSLPGIFIQSDASKISDSRLVSSEGRQYVPKEPEANPNIIGTYDCSIHEIESIWRNDSILDCSSLNIKSIDRPLMVESDIKTLSFANNMLQLLAHRIYDSGNSIAIDFSKNNLTYIGEHVFANLTQVRWLSLAQNRLREFDENVFNRLIQLETLDLSFNESSILNPKIFKKLMNLEELLLQNNRFAILRDDSFEHLIKLDNLDLSCNDLSALPDDIFKYNHHLRNLDISGNNLKQIPNEALGSASRLNYLNLASNKFTRLDYPSFSKLSSVRILLLEKI